MNRHAKKVRSADSSGRRQRPMGAFEALEQRWLLAADLPAWVSPSHWHQGWELTPAEVAIYTPQGPLQVGQVTLLAPKQDYTDELGNELFVEPPAPDGLMNGSLPGAEVPAPAPLADTFKLHSRPGALHTVYLDFDGHTTTGTTWNFSSGQSTIVSPAYDPGNNGAAFSDSELASIQNIWKRIAEDFSPFQVDITTQDPGAAALSKTGGGDTQWGVRVVITPTDWDNCQCGGFAYLNSFNDAVDEPVFIFNGSEIGVSAAASHEVGHSLGLSHDGTTTGTEYYAGHGINNSETEWGPIMGSGYYANMTTWDTGEYYLANNHENDWQVITSNNGFGYRTDDHGGSPSTATPIDVLGVNAINPALVDVAGFGVIERDTDTDWFKFETGAGTVNLIINSYVQETFVSTGAGYTRTVENSPFNDQGSDLDIEAKIYDSSLNVVATSNPATGLSAAFSNLTLSAGIYYLVIDGVGVGNWAINPPSGYDQSVSRGQYAISGTVAEVGLDTPLSPLERIDPKGSLVSHAQQSGTITTAGEVDSFSVALQPGQLLSVEVAPDATLQAVVRVLDSSSTKIASQTGTNAGDDVILQTVLIPSSGSYTISIAGAGGTSGRYATRLVLNAAIEQTQPVGTKQAIDESALQLGSERYAVLGKNSSVEATQFVKTNNPGGFVDISSSGTPLGLSDDGVATITTTVGNSALPAGSVRVSNNGGIFAGSVGSLHYVNSTLPNSALGNALLPFWDDLNATSGNVYWQELSIGGINALVVQWENRPHYNQVGNATFQLQLFESGATLVRFAYKDIDFGNAAYNGGNSATIGYQLNNTTAIQFSSNSAAVANGDVVDLIHTSPEVDEYTLDLSAFVGSRVDALLTGLDGADLSGGSLELLDPNGSVVATAVANPLGVPAVNFDWGIVNHLVSSIGNNIYTLRLGFTLPAEYGLVVTESLVFDTEPNNDLASDALRSLSLTQAALGYLAATTDAVDYYAISLEAGQTIDIETSLPWGQLTAAPTNSLDPELAIVAEDKSTVLVSDQNGLDGKNARLLFTAATEATYYLRVSATSGDGEYVLHAANVNTLPAPNVESVKINDDGASRSIISYLTVTFDSLIDHTQIVDAFVLTNIDTNIQVQSLIVGTPIDFGGKTTVELTFGSGVSVQNRMGVGLLGNSLGDGNYRLDILAGKVKAAAGSQLMATDYIFGGKTMAQPDPNNERFFRLLGDANGDGVRNGIDLNAIIPTLFNPPSYRADLDTNGDGVINGIDLNGLIPTLFGQRRL